MQTPATGFLYDPCFLEHNPGEGHPECRARLEMTLAHLEPLDWFRHLVRVAPRPAEMEDLERVHDAAYIAHVKEACESGERLLDSPDVGICEASWEAAVLAAGGALELADQMMAGRIINGFGLIRPPGHHAETAQALGFCLFNNIAILARYLQQEHGLGKILILDWDVHHGNGTQHTFEDDPTVFYISLHQFPFYPGTGAAHETGHGDGRGYTLNCPMPPMAEDADYEEAFREKILPRAFDYKPDAVLISAGFDAHHQDPLAQIRLTTGFYGWMTACMMEVAAASAHGRVLSLLEGGYDLEALPRSIEAHLAVLAGIKTV